MGTTPWCHPLTALPLLLVFISAPLIRETWAATECQVQFETNPDVDRITLVTAVLACTGDPVTFTVGSDIIAYVTDSTGVATLNPDPDTSNYGGVLLEDAADVTFTSVLVRYYDYATESAALTLRRCSSCVVRNVVVDDIWLRQATGSVLRFEDSSVTVEGALFTHLGQEATDYYGNPVSTSGAAISAVSSDVVLQDVLFDSSLMTVQVAAVTVDGGALRAADCTWQDLRNYVPTEPMTFPPLQGRAIVASNGAKITLQSCTMEAVDVRPLDDGREAALIHLSSGASVAVSTDSTLFVLPADTGIALLADGAGSLSLDGNCLHEGDSTVMRRPSLATMWARPAVHILNHGSLEPLSLSNMAVRISASSSNLVLISGGNLIRLIIDEGSLVETDSVSFTGLSALPGPAVSVRDSTYICVDCTFSSLWAAPDADINVDNALALDVSASSVTLTSCTFSNISWSTAWESQAVRLAASSTLVATDTSFSEIGGAGTALRVREASRAELRGVNITDMDISAPIGEKRAVVIVDPTAVLRATDSAWQRINVGNSTNGAALAALEAAEISLTGCTFADVHSPLAPAVQVSAPAPDSISFTACEWQNVTGTALRLNGVAGTATLADGSFADCEAGPALSLQYCAGTGSVQVQNMTFSNNVNNGVKEVNTGGALVSINCTVGIRESTFNGNSAITGGAISTVASTLRISDSAFIANSAVPKGAQDGAGGAVFADTSNLLLQCDNCTFIANSATGGRPQGGAVCTAGGALALRDSTLMRNTVRGTNNRGSGGAVYCERTRASVIGTTLFANGATYSGGALHAAYSPLLLQDSALLENSAAWGGGVFLFEADTSLPPAGSASVLSTPPPSLAPPSSPPPPLPSPAGQRRLLADVSDPSSLAASSPPPPPAALSSSSSFYTIITNTSFTKNKCTDNSSTGGALTAVRRSEERWKLGISLSTFVGNSCPTGGAVSSQMLDTVTIMRSTFRANRANSSGGAISLMPSDPGTVSAAILRENTFLKNKASQVGGAVQAGYGWSIEVTFNTFTANGNSDTDLAGGAMYVEKCKNLPSSPATNPNVYLQYNTFTENTARDGGAFYATMCNVTVYRDSYSNNYVTGSGGALSGANTEQILLSTLQLRETRLEGNMARGSGGAVNVIGQGLALLHSTFSSNVANIAGGAVFASESSPVALKTLNRTSDPYYTQAERNFLRFEVFNTTFTGNSAESGGGAVYIDSTELLVQKSKFTSNIAGDGFPNDEWSDSGGAVFGAACFGLTSVYTTTFEGNRANGGPGGAILKTACSISLQNCSFANNVASTFGGAIAASNRRKADSTALDTPNLVIVQCGFTNNTALTDDGGAAFTRDINATLFTSTFSQNSAGGSGGAMAFLNNLGTAVQASTFEDNSAQAYGGAAYLLTTPLVSVIDSQFRRNYAAQTGGALSIVQCNCTLTSHTSFEDNWADAYGGALHLQPKTTLPGDTNELADSGNCVGEFLQQIRLRMSRQGRDLLRTVDRAVESYNATIVYNAASLGYQSIGLFGRGGVQLPVPSAKGPAQLFGYDVTVVPADQSTVQLAAGSTLPYTNWVEYLIQADDVATHVINTNADTDIDVVSGVEMVLAAGSTVTVLSPAMAMLPTDGSITVQGSRWLLDSGMLMEPSNAVPVLTAIPAARAVIRTADGATFAVADWNRYALWSSRLGTILYDAFTGHTDLLDSGATVSVANGSPLTSHAAGTVTLATAGTLRVQAGAWVLGNGSTVAAGGSTVALSAVPAAGSNLTIAVGSTVAVTDWASLIVRLSATGIRLEHASLGSSAELFAGVSVSLGQGSAISLLRDGMAWLPSQSQLSVEGSAWSLYNGTVISPEGGDVATTLVLTPGSVVQLADGGAVTVTDWNRHTLWAGPVDTLLYDSTLGTVAAVVDESYVSLASGAAVTYHGDAALLAAGMQLRVTGTTWLLSNGTTLSTGGSVVALTALAAFQSTVPLANGTSLQARDWYRYVVWAGQAATYVYDTSSDSSYQLADGSTVSLARLSVLVAHSSHTSVTSGEAAYTVQGGALVASNGSLMAPSQGVQQVLVLPAATTSMSFGSDVSLAVDSTAPYTMWTGRNGSFLFDTNLLAGYRLADGSSVGYTPGSFLVSHDSATTALTAATNLTADGLTWTLSNGMSLSIGGGVASLAAVPAAGSHLVFQRPWGLTLNGNSRYGLWAGASGTVLYDAVLHASYALADGSKLQLAGNSTLTYRGQASQLLPAGTGLTVRGARWALDDGTTVNAGDGTGSTEQAVMSVYTPSISLVQDEVDRVCAVDFATAQYQANPYSYDYAALEAYLLSLPLTAFNETNISPKVAAAAYGAGADTSGYNAALLVAGAPYSAWEDLGRPSGVQVTCTATTVPPATSYARGVNTVLLGVTATSNVAQLRGGAITVDGGYGRVLMDGLQVRDNTVLEGNGGGMAIYQSGDQRNMQLEVYVTSSTFGNNAAAVGSGGGLYVGSELTHQQVMLLNTTLDSNRAAVGGGLSAVKQVSVALNQSTVSNNVADSTNLGSNSAVDFANQQNLGSGGGIMASLCHELHLTAGTVLSNNTATGRGGGLSASACALLLVNSTHVTGNTAQSAGGVYVWNNLAVKGTYRADNPVGASIAVVLKSDFEDNSARNTTASETELEGFGGGFMVNGHVSTLLADSNFEGNVAAMQGGSIFIESVCDLDSAAWFLARNMSAPTAWPGVESLLGRTVNSLQWPRPKYCWGTVVYLPRFFKNEAARSGGALFASHPEALSLVCDSEGNATTTTSASGGAVSPLSIDYANFDEGYLAAGVLSAMKKASFQLLDNRIVQNCYKDEITRLYNQTVRLTGSQLSTLSISNNRAKGYGYLIAIIPSKLRILNVSWTGNTSNVAGSEMQMVDAGGLDSMEQQLSMVLGMAVGNASSTANTLTSLEARPLFNAAPGSVFDPDTNDYRQTVNYHITTYSNIPMDMPVVLLDALDQVASENTTLRQAQVRARYLSSTNGCKAELLGGIEGVARNGTAMMNAMRLRALKGENYSIEFRVEDSTFAGTVEPLVVNVTVPACGIGEVPRDNGYLCQKCDPRSFSLWQDLDPLVNCTYPDLVDITCMPCPDGAECPGGAVVVPRAGYWHSAANATYLNPCQNQEACRDGDDEAQDLLVQCQTWWYSRPAGFDYQAFADSVLAGNSTNFPDAPGALPDGTYNTSDPELCVLWGLPYDHPASYAFKQCAEGYGGNLCAVCLPVDGVQYAGDDDLECKQCFSKRYSIAIAVAGFVANVVTVLITIVLTFLADYTEDEELAIGDLLKVLIVHIQFLVIVTRLNIDWPASISGLTSIVSALTGAVAKVYTPACLLGPEATPADAARINQLAAIATPLVCTVVVAVLWLLRFMLFNFRSLPSGQRAAKDMRTIAEYRHERAQRLAAKRRQASKRHMEDMMSDVDFGAYGPTDDEEDGLTDAGHSEAGTRANTYRLLSYESPAKGLHSVGSGGISGAINGQGEGGVVLASDHIGVTIPLRSPDSHGNGDASPGVGAVAHIVDMPPPPPAPLPPPAAPPPPLPPLPPVSPLRPAESLRTMPPAGSGALKSPGTPGGAATAGSGKMSPFASRKDVSTFAAGGGGGGADRNNSIGRGSGAGTDRNNSIGRGGSPARASSRRQQPPPPQQRQSSLKSRAGGGSDAGSLHGSGEQPAERTVSGMQRLRGALSAGSLLVRNFFKYDEEGLEEGEVRWASLANIDRTMTWWRQELLVVMIACFILYPAWAQATLQIFACYYLDEGSGTYPDFQLAQWGRGYWMLNMNQECYAGEHSRVYVPLGLVCIVVVCIGIPFLTFFTMWSHRTALRTVHVAQTYGFLYRRYKYDKYYGWEAVMQLQTLLLVVVDVFGNVLAVYQQAVLLMLALLLIMWSNMHFQPLQHELLDRMSSLSLAVLSFTVALGLFFVPPADRKDPVTPVAAAAIGGIILALNIGLVIYFVYVMVTHGRDAIVHGVGVARETLVGATSKVQLGLSSGLSGITSGLRVVGGSVSNRAQRMRSVTAQGLSSIRERVKGEPGRRRASGNTA